MTVPHAWLTRALLPLTLCIVPAAQAQTTLPAGPVPIKVKWAGVKPAGVSLVSADGTEDLRYDEASATYTGNMPRPDAVTEQRTIHVNYGGRTFPLYINLRRTAPVVQFTLSIDMKPSCADLFVQGVEIAADNSQVAMQRMLTAAWMLNIPPNNHCTGARQPRAVKARFDRNYDLAQKSQGLFALSPEATAAYTRMRMAQFGVSETKAALLPHRYAIEINGLVAADIHADALTAAPAEGQRLLEDLAMAAQADPALAEGIAAQSIPLREDILDLSARVHAVGPR